MATIVTRETTQTDGTSPKGSPLTNAEVDTNFINLNDDKVEVSGAIIFQAKAGEALAKGDVVYVSGVSGNNPVVSKADADDASKMPAFGLAEADANNNAAVNVVTFGTLYDLDTSSFAAGDTVYVSTTAGALTTTAPTGESSLLQNIGKVIRSHASAGSIKVGGAGRTNATPNLDDGNVFIGNASNQAEARALTGDDISGGTITSFASTGIDDNSTANVLTIAGGSGQANSVTQRIYSGYNSGFYVSSTSFGFEVGDAGIAGKTVRIKNNGTAIFSHNQLQDVIDMSNASSVTVAGFTSTGIDDNATSTALTIDSAGDTTVNDLTANALTADSVNGLELGLGLTGGTSSVAVGENALASSLDAGDFNTAVGQNALTNLTTGDENTAIGQKALEDLTTADRCTAIGVESAQKNNADYTTAVGFRALEENTTGADNTAVGAFALEDNQTGNNNTAIGYSALEEMIDQVDNTAVGFRALEQCQDGGSNTAVGSRALSVTTGGEYNVAVGVDSLLALTTGLDNTAIGQTSLSVCTTGIENTAIGAYAGGNITTGSNNTVIGANAEASAADATNEITLGDDQITDVRIPALNFQVNGTGVGINNKAPSTELHIKDSNATLSSSVVQLKIETENTPSQLAEVVFDGESTGSVGVTSGAAGGTVLSNDLGGCGLSAKANGTIGLFTNGSAVNPDLLIDGTGNLEINANVTVDGFVEATDFRSSSSASTALTLTAAGSVGINGETPATELDIFKDRNPVLSLTSTLNDSGYANQSYGTINFSSDDLSGPGAGNPRATIAGVSTTSTGAAGAIAFSTTTGGSGVQVSEKMRLTPEGRLGLGTTTPGSSFHINQSSAVIRVQDSDGTNQYFDFIHSAGGTQFKARNNTSNGTIQFAGFDGTTTTEYGRFTAAGRFGVGTTAPAYPLEVKAATGASTINIKSPTTTDSSQIFFSDTSNGVGRITYNHNSNYMAFNINAAERLRVTSSGNVGIGDTTPDAGLTVHNNAGAVIATSNIARQTYTAIGNLQVSTAGSGGILIHTNSTTADGAITFGDGTFAGRITYEHDNDAMAFTTNASERLRIDSSGNLLVGKTSKSVGLGGFEAISSGRLNVHVDNGGTAVTQVAFYNGSASSAGSISSTGTTVAYNTSSDVRLKENITDAPAGNIDSIKVRSFDWKVNGEHQTYGFIAQELETVAPYAVTTGEDDEETGEEGMKSVDYSKLVPMLVKEIQDLKAEVAALKGS